MKKDNYIEPSNGVLTSKMDIGTNEFKEFQAILLNKSRERSITQKSEIELLSLRFKMEDYFESEEQEVKLPGEFLKQYLKTLKIPQKRFANYINLKPSNLSKLIKGERPINYELAHIFGNLFDNDPLLWIEIQAKNELKKISQTRKNDFHYSLNDLINK
jgi:addiction module HigA family antidote